MGGFGSGRRGGKSVTGDMLALDIRRLSRDGLLKPGQSFNWKWSRGGEAVGNINILAELNQVTLDYLVRDKGGDWQATNYSVRISWTPCTYGGRRAWLHCPAVGCGRRIAVLYGGSVFACRYCQQLAYRSQRENVGDRSTTQADKIRARLGWEPGILNGDGDKPKGMHWATFERLSAMHDALVNKSLAEILAKFEPLSDLIR